MTRYSILSDIGFISFMCCNYGYTDYQVSTLPLNVLVACYNDYINSIPISRL